MPLRVIVLLFMCVSLASAQSPLPTTPAGRVLTAWLSAFNSDDLAALQAFDATHRPDAPPVSVTQRLRSNTGGFTLVRIEKSTPTIIIALLEENDARRLARLELEVTDDAKPIVVSSTLRIVARTADIPLAGLSEAETISAVTAKMDDQLKEDRFAGAVVVGRQGRIVFQKAVGLANRESQTPNTLDTQFRNGSMNKMFTATAVMQLVEAGKLSLDDTVGKVM
jgi:D-alanyl-D-alanine carboxypeptidase